MGFVSSDEMTGATGMHARIGFECSPVLMAVLDPSNKIVLVNKLFEEQVGPSFKFSEITFDETGYDEVSRENMSTALKRVRAGGKSVKVRNVNMLTLAGQDGFPTPCSFDWSFKLSQDSSTVCVAGEAVAEAVERKDAELLDFFQNAPIAIQWVTGAGVALWANHRMLEDLGYTAEEFIGQPIVNFCPDDVELVTAVFKQLSSSGAPIKEVPVKFRTKDGRIMYFLIDSSHDPAASTAANGAGDAAGGAAAGGGGGGGSADTGSSSSTTSPSSSSSCRCFIRDDTGRKVREAEKNLLLKETQRTLDLFDAFVARTVHLIRTPCHVLQACLENAAREGKNQATTTAAATPAGAGEAGGREAGGDAQRSGATTSESLPGHPAASSSSSSSSSPPSPPPLWPPSLSSIHPLSTSACDPPSSSSSSSSSSPSSSSSSYPPASSSSLSSSSVSSPCSDSTLVAPRTGCGGGASGDSGAVGGSGSGAKSEGATAGAEENKLLGYVLESTELVRQIVAMITDLGDSMRFEQGATLKVRKQPTDLREVGKHALSAVLPLVQNSSVALVLEFEQGGTQVDTDAEVLSRILGHLLRNAVQATKEGSVTLRISHNPDTVTVAVLDTGKGLSSEALSFERYCFPKPTLHPSSSKADILALCEGDSASAYHADRDQISLDLSLSSDRQGMGVGLSLSYALAQSLGAELLYESQPGATRFWFSLPRKTAAERGQDAPALRLSFSAADHQTPTRTRSGATQLRIKSLARAHALHQASDFVDTAAAAAAAAAAVANSSCGGGCGGGGGGGSNSSGAGCASMDSSGGGGSSSGGACAPPTLVRAAGKGGQNPLFTHAEQPPHVLVVEDSKLCAKMLVNKLKLAGCTAQVAEDGAVAVETLRENPTSFDLVLMDIRMPVMDGYEATRIAKNELKLMVPIVAVTAETGANMKSRCAEVGFDRIFAKPVSLDHLTSLLGSLLLSQSA